MGTPSLAALSLIICTLAPIAYSDLISLGGDNLIGSSPGPTAAGQYLDKLFADTAAARSQLTGNFTKKSNTAIVYMCFDRGEIIRQTFAALLRTEDIGSYDVFISQDGNSSYALDVPIPPNVNYVYIRHPENLCAGLHHHFVKAFAFDIMAYDNLLVVEEDNIVHPQAMRLLGGMLAQSVDDRQIGLVSISDMDNSVLFDETRYNAAYVRAETEQGHLWVFGVHLSRWQAVRADMYDYYDLIKRHDYRSKSKPPLSTEIAALMERKGFGTNHPLSQDSFFVRSLFKSGYIRRFMSLTRLYEPVGWKGLHFNKEPTAFFAIYGRGMYEANITSEPFDVSKSPADLLAIEKECKERMVLLYQLYLERSPDSRALNGAVMRLVTGKLNAVQLMHNVVNSAEFDKRMKRFVYKAVKENQTATLGG